MKYLSIVLLLTSFAFADYSSITSELCPSTPAGMEANLTDKKISNDYFNTCQGVECDSLAVFYGEEITESVKVIEVNKDEIALPPIRNKFKNLSSLTIAGQEIEVKDTRFDSARLECAYKNNALVYASLSLGKKIDDSNNKTYFKVQNSKVTNSVVFNEVYIEELSDNLSKYTSNAAGNIELKYTNDNSTIRIYSNKFEADNYEEFDKKGNSKSRLTQSGPMTLSISVDQDSKNYTFDFESSESCGFDDSDVCENGVIQTCYGPFDLKSDSDIIGDIKLCNTGTEIRKNVLQADGSITKVVIK